MLHNMDSMQKRYLLAACSGILVGSAVFAALRSRQPVCAVKMDDEDDESDMIQGITKAKIRKVHNELAIELGAIVVSVLYDKRS